MIAKLSHELALELDRGGDRPLSVEHPRTHKRFVIVSADEYASGGKIASSSGRSQQLDRRKKRPAFRTHRQRNRRSTHAHRGRGTSDSATRDGRVPAACRSVASGGSSSSSRTVGATKPRRSHLNHVPVRLPSPPARAADTVLKAIRTSPELSPVACATNSRSGAFAVCVGSRGTRRCRWRSITSSRSARFRTCGWTTTTCSAAFSDARKES